MASSGNFCTLSPLDRSEYGTAPSLTGGNLRYQTTGSGPGNNDATRGTIATPTTGKWYFEFVDVQQFTVVGMQEINPNVRKWNTNGYPVTQSGITQFYIYPNAGDIDINNSYSGSVFTAFSDGDIGGIAIDLDNGAFYLHNAGTYVNSGDPTSGSSKTGSLGNITTGTEYIPITCNHSYGSDTRMYFNFGQDSTFQGYTTAGGNADANGFGDFKYAPPSGYLALCSANLSISDDIDPAQTDDDYPQKQFNTVLYTGNGSTQSITGLGFQPDLVWAKSRSASQSHRLADSSRGSAVMFSDTSGANDTTAGISFDSDGFSWTNSDGSNANDSSKTYVAWCWKAKGGTETTNNDGNVTSYVQANTKAGFSIVRHSSSLGSSSSLGHGLGVKPDFFVHKLLASGTNWSSWHNGLSGSNYIVRINSTSAEFTSTHLGEPSSSVLNFGSGLSGTGAGIAYCWHNVEGFQKFGTYEGNGSTDGTFVYTGFRPRMVFLKQIDGAAEWAVYDTARNTFNEMGNCLEWDLSAAEKTHASDLTTDAIMFFSNGFKLTGGGGGRTNQSGRTYVFGAWSDVSFKYNNTF